MTIPHYYPKGQMCCSCARAACDCTKLDFQKMPPIRRDPNGDVAVACSKFERSEK